jgi:hypothetical protein
MALFSPFQILKVSFENLYEFIKRRREAHIRKYAGYQILKFEVGGK